MNSRTRKGEDSRQGNGDSGDGILGRWGISIGLTGRDNDELRDLASRQGPSGRRGGVMDAGGRIRLVN